MDRIRTIDQAVYEIKLADPDSALTTWAVRQLVKNGTIPCLSVGNKKLISMEVLEKYIGETCRKGFES